MEIRRLKIKGSINLVELDSLHIRILKLPFLDNWSGLIRVVSLSKSFRDSEGRLHNYSNENVMRGIRTLVNKKLLESR